MCMHMHMHMHMYVHTKVCERAHNERAVSMQLDDDPNRFNDGGCATGKDGDRN